MSKHRSHTHRHATVIAVDGNFMPMLEVSRRHALKALATGRAHALDIRTWGHLSLQELMGMPLKIIVFPKAKAMSEARLSIGRGARGILRRDGFCCQYCGGKATTVDHVHPRCQGGKTSWDNLVASCKPCNQIKGGRTPEQANMRLRSQIRSPRYHLMQRFQAIVEEAA